MVLLHIPELESAAGADGASSETLHEIKTIDNSVSGVGDGIEVVTGISAGHHTPAVINVAAMADTDGISLTIRPTELKLPHMAIQPLGPKRLCCKDPAEMSRPP